MSHRAAHERLSISTITDKTASPGVLVVAEEHET